MENDKLALNIAPIVAELQNVPVILEQNDLISSKAVAVGEKLITLAENEGMNAELDKRMNDFLVKANVRVKELEAKRKPLTTFLGTITSTFTSFEKRISKGNNSIVDQIQAKRNEYAAAEIARKRAEQQKIERENAIKAERASYVIDYRAAIKRNYYAFVELQKKSITEIFENATLDSMSSVVTIVRNFNDKLSKEDYEQKILAGIFVKAIYLDAGDVEKCIAEAKAGNNLQADFAEQINNHKNSILDVVGSKIKELEEIEKSRIAAEEAKKQADKLAAEAKTKEAKEAAEKAQKEAAEKAEAAKKEAEAAEQRKKEAQKAAEAEAQKAAEAEAQKALTNKNVMQANLNFENEMQMSQVAAPKVKTSYEIIVKHQNGYQLIAAKYFEKQALNETIEALGRKTLDQMKSFCEKLANDSSEFIDSKMLEYKEVIKAVNSKK